MELPRARHSLARVEAIRPKPAAGAKRVPQAGAKLAQAHEVPAAALARAERALARAMAEAMSAAAKQAAQVELLPVSQAPAILAPARELAVDAELRLGLSARQAPSLVAISQALDQTLARKALAERLPFPP